MYKSLENKKPLCSHDALLNNYNMLVMTADVSFVLFYKRLASMAAGRFEVKEFKSITW